MKVVTVEQMRRLEAASDAAGHSYAAMMERAGRAVAEAMMQRIPVKGKRVLVLVGPGNNGGDGLVAARYLAEAGAEVACYLLKPRDPEADENFRLVGERGVFVAPAGDDAEGRVLQRLTRGADVVVDALLGTGTRLPLKGALAKMLREVGRWLAAREEGEPCPLTSLRPFGYAQASSRGPSSRSGRGSARGDKAQGTALTGGPTARPSRRWLVVAVDGPSGLDYDTGALDEAAIPADLTVTFAYPKRGHFRFPGAGALGELVVADIGTDPALAADVALEVVTAEMVRGWLPPRPPDAHKGTFGRALVVAGSANYTGAAYLAGAAATRAGAGLVTVALPSAIHLAVAAKLSETTYLLLPHELGVISADALRVLAERMGDYDALLVGPGLGREKETVAFVKGLLGGVRERRRLGFGVGEEAEPQSPSLPPLIVDADGLNILSEMADWPKRLPAGTVLTPHPGEMARLMGCSVGEVQADRVEVAQRQAAAWGHVVVLKGAYTVVAASDGRTAIEPFANPGLASGGTGDVLAGAIVALRAQGLGPFEAAAAGAYLHGLAGELARQALGAAGMVAGDVLARLPNAWIQVSNDQWRLLPPPLGEGRGRGHKCA